MERYISEGVWPGGVDWTGATVIEYTIRVEPGCPGCLFKGFIQSIEEESEDYENWLWRSTLIPIEDTGGELITLTFDLRPDPPEEEGLNLEDVTKMGCQIHAPELEPEDDAGTGDTEIPLPEPLNARVQVDSIVVRGPEYVDEPDSDTGTGEVGTEVEDTESESATGEIGTEVEDTETESESGTAELEDSDTLDTETDTQEPEASDSGDGGVGTDIDIDTETDTASEEDTDTDTPTAEPPDAGPDAG
jgi:hypothetical protein